MATKIPDFVKKVMQDWSTLLGTPEVYLAGGSLAEHKTNDYDIVILSEEYSDALLPMIQQYYAGGNCEAVEVYRAYDIEPDAFKEDDGKFHTKAVCTINGTKVDLLFANNHKHSIRDILDKFPLSIQMQAQNIHEELIRGKRYCDNPIINFYGTRAFKKYLVYYPDRRFIDASYS